MLLRSGFCIECGLCAFGSEYSSALVFQIVGNYIWSCLSACFDFRDPFGSLCFGDSVGDISMHIWICSFEV